MQSEETAQEPGPGWWRKSELLSWLQDRDPDRSLRESVLLCGEENVLDSLGANSKGTPAVHGGLKKEFPHDSSHQSF